MKIPGLRRSAVRAACALGAVSLGAAALAGGQSFLPGEGLSALRSLLPIETLVFQLLLIGWIGVALGHFTVGPEPGLVRRGGQTVPHRETAVNEEKVDRILRQIAKVLQTHLTDSASFSERLDGANERLSQQESIGPVKDIVLASSTTIATCATSFPTSETSSRNLASRSCSCKRTSSGPRRPGCAMW